MGIRAGWGEVEGQGRLEWNVWNEGRVVAVKRSECRVGTNLNESSDIVRPKLPTEYALALGSLLNVIRVPDGTPTVVRDRI